MTDLQGYLNQMQDIIGRTQSFRANEASDPKEFSETVVEDIGALAAAVADLIKRIEAA